MISTASLLRSLADAVDLELNVATDFFETE
jgi:hypothetical protein